MTNIVTDLILSEISLVDEGANDGARVVIVKAKDNDPPEVLQEFTDALETVNEKLVLLEQQVLETEAEVVKVNEEIVQKTAELARLSDPDALLKAKATEIHKAAPQLTDAQAYSQAVDQNPALYAAYVSKRRPEVSNADIAKRKSAAAETLLGAKAVEIQKANPKFSAAQAYERATLENPGLYNDYVAHRRLA